MYVPCNQSGCELPVRTSPTGPSLRLCYCIVLYFEPLLATQGGSSRKVYAGPQHKSTHEGVSIPVRTVGIVMCATEPPDPVEGSAEAGNQGVSRGVHGRRMTCPPTYLFASWSYLPPLYDVLLVYGMVGIASNCKLERERAMTSDATSLPYCSAN